MPPLELAGLVVRNTRLNQGLTQQRAARLAGVSRKQWALLESGENVSVVFLQKVMRSLGLTQCPIAEQAEATSSIRGINVDELLQLCGELALLLQRFERLAFEAALPLSERSGDAAAIDSYLRDTDDLPSDVIARVRSILRRTASDSAPAPPEPAPTPKREAARRKRRA